MSIKAWWQVMERHPYRSIVIFFAVLYLLGNQLLPMTDPVEANYTETAREMLAAGDWLSPRIYGHFWYDKPPLFYWELMAAFSVLGFTDFAARLFPVVFSIVSLCLTYRLGSYIYDRCTGLLGAFILGTAGGYWYFSKAVITDMTLLVFFSLTLMTFYAGWRTGNRRWYLGSFACAALGVLTKGPIAFLLPGFVYLVFLCVRRRPGEILRIHWPLGLVLFCAVAGIWYWPMAQLHGQAFLDTFLGTHNFLRAAVPEHPETNVWYYYAAVSLAAFMPWSLPALYALWQKRRSLQPRQWSDGTIFLVVWAVTVTLFYQCMATKYPTYTLPAFLPAAILLARLLRNYGRICRWLLAGWSVALVVLTFTVAVPQVERASEQAAAQVVQRALAEEPQLPVYYFGDYKSSLVYYLQAREVYSLKPRARIAEMLPVPGESSWRDRNVMPFAAVEELPTDTPLVIVAARRPSRHSPEQLTDCLPAQTQLTVLGETPQSIVYRVVIPQERTD